MKEPLEQFTLLILGLYNNAFSTAEVTQRRSRMGSKNMETGDNNPI
jgi:hypothetical protein